MERECGRDRWRVNEREKKGENERIRSTARRLCTSKLTSKRKETV